MRTQLTRNSKLHTEMGSRGLAAGHCLDTLHLLLVRATLKGCGVAGNSYDLGSWICTPELPILMSA